MPEMRRYIVTQTRVVEVDANSTTDAALLAQTAFIHGQNANGRIDPDKRPNVWGDTKGRIREIEISVKDMTL